MKKLLASVAAITVIGAAGLGLTQSSEGLRLKVYADPAGYHTVCWGHMDQSMPLGAAYTVEQCEALLQEDYADAANGLNRCLRPKMPLTVNQSDALVDLAFNVGAGAVCRSSIPASLARADLPAVTQSILSFDKATVRGVLRRLAGLVKRRQAEVKLFNTPVTGNEDLASLDNLKKLTVTR